MSTPGARREVGGPWFEDFERGQMLRGHAGMTLTESHAAAAPGRLSATGCGWRSTRRSAGR